MKQDRRQEFIKKAEACKPEIYMSIAKPMKGLPTAALHTGDSVVFDFGNHFTGRLSFRCMTEGSHPDAPAFIKIKFCENQKELEEDSADYQGWISKGWIQEEWLHIDVFPAEIKLPRRYAFRYVKIEVLDVSSKYSLIIDDMEAESYTSADDESVGSFSGNELEQQLDKVSIRTLRNCMQDVFEDGPKRDRRLWIGDLRLQALANYASYQKNELVKRCLYLFAGTADDEGRVRACLFTEPEIEGDDTYMFDYSLFFIPALLDYYEATGDRETAEDLLETAWRQLEVVSSYFDEKHLVKDSDVLGWCFLDWNLELNKQAGAQAVYIYCAKAMVRLLELLNEDAVKVKTLQEDIALKIKAAREYLYDAEQGLFVSGADRQISYASQAWAVLAGIFDDETNRGILARIEACSDAVQMVTPYMYHHFVDALHVVGEKKRAYEVMTEYWGAMVANGADTFYELFNPKNPAESPYGSSIVNSYCHAWSCTPVYFMRKCKLVEKAIKEEVRAFIFDLDGVIVFTDKFHYQAWKHIADEMGIYFDEKINNRLRGVSRMESLEIILEKYDSVLSDEMKVTLAERKNDIYRKLLENMTPEDVSEEVRQTLKMLRRKGYKLAIGSSSKNAKFILEKVELTDYFDVISDGTNITKSKPDPEVFLKAAEFLGETPKACIVVEDAQAGIDAAKAGNMRAVGIGEAASYGKTDFPIHRFGELLML